MKSGLLGFQDLLEVVLDGVFRNTHGKAALAFHLCKASKIYGLFFKVEQDENDSILDLVTA